MSLAIRVLSSVGLCVAVCGCGGAAYEGPQRFPLTGKVTLDGQPVDGGSISFLPEGEGAGRVAGGPIDGGAYSVPEEQGATAGSYRVEIRWPRPTGKKIKDSDTGGMIDQVAEAIPAKYNIQSGLTAEVGEGKTNFDFDLKSK